MGVNKILDRRYSSGGDVRDAKKIAVMVFENMMDGFFG
jgi:hypothetical protein